MNVISQLFDPVLLILAAGLPFGVGAILFVLYHRGPATSIVPGMPLSWAEPVEIRLVLYLLFAAVWGVVALVPRVVYLAAPEGSAIAVVLLLLTAVAFLFDVAFVYAAVGTLLHAAFGTRGRPPFWFSRVLAPLDSTIMTFGDLFARVMLPQGGGATARRAPEVEIEFESESLAPEEAPQPGRPRSTRANRRDPYAAARERIDTTLAEYESRLSPAQLEKYLLMKEIVAYLRGRDGALV